MHRRLTTQPVGIIHNAHILFPIVAVAYMFHSLAYFAHAGRAEPIPAACVFHGYPMIDGDLEDGLAILRFYGPNLAIVMEGNLRH